jgi:hypothetical protein
MQISVSFPGIGLYNCGQELHNSYIKFYTEIRILLSKSIAELVCSGIHSSVSCCDTLSFLRSGNGTSRNQAFNANWFATNAQNPVPERKRALCFEKATNQFFYLIFQNRSDYEL